MAGILVLAGWAHLATPLVCALFGYLLLRKLPFAGRWGKLKAVVVFWILVAALVLGSGHLVKLAFRSLPIIADKAIPSVLQLAEAHDINLPFTDYDSLKEAALDVIKGEVSYFAGAAKAARAAGTQLVLLVVGCVVAVSVFLHPQFELDAPAPSRPENLYRASGWAISRRFTALYDSFAIVMGAQIIIAAINAALTAIFAIALQFPYLVLIIGVTFLCGLLPVIGNLLSNTLIVGIAFTMSPGTAVAALVFLVVVHKLEYFLNSKIIGARIRNPLWLTLLGLVVGERLMGIPGIILAPVLLHYVKSEAARLRGPETSNL
jgi:predicted PurR-regulated permease PerM